MFNEHVRNFKMISLIAKNAVRVRRVREWLFISFRKIRLLRFKFRSIFVSVVESSQSFNFFVVFVFVFYIYTQSLSNIFIMRNYSQRRIIQVSIIIITLCTYALTLFKIKETRSPFIHFLRCHHRKNVLDFWLDHLITIKEM